MQSEVFKPPFVGRHIGPTEKTIKEMLDTLGVATLDELIDKTVPESIRLEKPFSFSGGDDGLTEFDALKYLKEIADKNQVLRSLIGLGYSDTITPPVVQRNILENPSWYTSYTPYQAEISQGRLEALLNFQTMICDLTGMSLANSSLLDEGTAVAEAVNLAFAVKGSDSKNVLLVSAGAHPQTLDVVETRAVPIGIEVRVVEELSSAIDDSVFAVVIQYPESDGRVVDPSAVVEKAKSNDALSIFAADLLSLALLKPPGEMGADIVVGNSQRFGVPLGFGGPHAAFFATSEEHKRFLPGRLVGVSKDADGNPALRLALQTREQHIKRERATSNICTAQVLLAVIASMYAVFHGPKGIKRIASRVHKRARDFAKGIKESGLIVAHEDFFDTVRVENPGEIEKRALSEGFNLRYFDNGDVSVSFDEKSTEEEVSKLLSVFSETAKYSEESEGLSFPSSLERSTEYLTHPVFTEYRSETEVLRYIHFLAKKDISLTNSMIPLGSCTMKLNATAEMMPISFEGFSCIHPFAPKEQTLGYAQLVKELEDALCDVTGFDGCSLQPNSGAQGEFAGLLAIRNYHLGNGEDGRNVCVIPSSAHGTNPASAVLAGMKVVTTKCDENGNINLEDLREKAEKHSSELAALMVTYPSTHGVFEEDIIEICDIIHQHGGQVYMDGANLNAQVGLCQPAKIGADVCHINLHKTFCIPHGGGGPGVGPIAVAKHLVPYLPGHVVRDNGAACNSGAVSAAPWGSASILPISFAYIKMMGAAGITDATRVAILNANYIAKRLENHFPVLYKGSSGYVAHECILDLRNFKRSVGIEVADVAKRLIDYGFHAPTVSFPVIETLMVEPTESESKDELDRFCDAMISIREEIQEVESGKVDPKNNVLKNAPHTAKVACADEWSYPYSRSKAVYPLEWLKDHKYWPPVRRIDNAYGDRNLFCSCILPDTD